MSKFGRKSDKPTRLRLPKFWSFSRWGTYDKCPRMYRHAHVEKLPQPFSKAMERGILVHREAENYVRGRTDTLSGDLHDFREELANIRDAGFKAEESWTVTKTWQVTHAKDWDHAWLRGKADASNYARSVIDMIDYKTGRYYPSHDEQAEVLALLGFALYPRAKTIDEEFWYLDQGTVKVYSFKRTRVPVLKKKWNARARIMLSDDVLKEKPSESSCKWCSFRSDRKLGNGEDGPCHGWKSI